MMRHLVSSTDRSRVFVYTASDERLLTFDCAGGDCVEGQARETWTLRDLSGQLLRVWDHPFGSQWFWTHDYIHRDGIPVVMATTDGFFHLHPDHLGSTRQITNDNGAQVARHSYHPYGTEATDPAQTTVGLRFTGHERDPNEPGSGASPVGTGQLDYMHARYGSPVLGRFTSVDPLVGSPGAPQSWNRYAYVMGNPINYTDPFGLEPELLFEGSINVYAYTEAHTAERLAVARRQFYRSVAGSLTSHRGFTVRDLARQAGRSKCRGFACTVMGHVGSVSEQSAALEFLVAEATTAWLAAPGMILPRGGALWIGRTGSAASRGTTRLLSEISRTGHLTQEGLDHIVLRHWASSGARNSGKFAHGTTARQLRSMIGDTLERGTIRANTAGRPGHIFEYSFGHPIGVNRSGNPATHLRVVRMPNGTIKTAFPF